MCVAVLGVEEVDKGVWDVYTLCAAVLEALESGGGDEREGGGLSAERTRGPGGGGGGCWGRLRTWCSQFANTPCVTALPCPHLCCGDILRQCRCTSCDAPWHSWCCCCCHFERC